MIIWVGFQTTLIYELIYFALRGNLPGHNGMGSFALPSMNAMTNGLQVAERYAYCRVVSFEASITLPIRSACPVQSFSLCPSLLMKD
jgi:hypothetical protein